MRSVVEFEADLDGVYVQGADILRWNAEGKLVSFTVMMRDARAAKAARADGPPAGRRPGLTARALARRETMHPAGPTIDSAA
jgi:hypothetical protein